MSYIRGTSNPEALYIWSDAERIVHVQMGTEFIGTLPVSVMDGLIERYVRNYLEGCKYNGAEIREIQDKDGNFKLEFSYNNWKCVMWSVTWDYVALSNIQNIVKKKTFFRTRNTKLNLNKKIK
jgi:hypothetical protein